MNILNRWIVLGSLLITLSCADYAFAEGEVPAEPDSEWRLYPYAGIAFSGKTSYTVKVDGTPLATADDKGKVSPNVGAELNWQLGESAIGISTIVEWNQYKYKDGTPADTHLGIYLMPRLRTSRGSVTYWIGPAFGLNRYSIGKSSDTVGGVTVAYDDSAAVAFAFAPRAGVDFDFGSGTTLGFFLGYVTSSADLDGSITSGAATVRFANSAGRSMFVAGLRVGLGM